MTHAIRMFCIGLWVVLPLAIGCGKKAVDNNHTKATGTVSLNGQPLGGGSIILVSAADPMSRTTAVLRSNGGFYVTDAPVGPVKIAVETESLKLVLGPDGKPTGYVPIPKKYEKPETSGLTATIVKDGGEPLSIELKSK